MNIMMTNIKNNNGVLTISQYNSRKQFVFFKFHLIKSYDT